MKFPLNFHIGSMIINAHVVFEFLAYALGFRYYLYLRKNSKDQISSGDRIWLIIAGGVGAILGSRIVGFFSTSFEIHSVNDFWMQWFNG